MKKIILLIAAIILLAVPAFALMDSDGNGATDIPKGGTNATTVEGAKANLGIPSNLSDLVEDLIDASGFGTAGPGEGPLATTDDTVQEIAQAFEDLLFTELDFTGTTGLSDGDDETGLPDNYFFLSEFETPASDRTSSTIAAAISAISTGDVVLYIDDTYTVTDGSTHTFPANIRVEFTPSGKFVDGAGVSGSTVTFNNLKAPKDITIFSGFDDDEIVLNGGVQDIYGQWFGLVSGDSIDDYAAFNSLFDSLTGYQNVYMPFAGDYNCNIQTGWGVPGIKYYQNASTVVTDTDSGFLNVQGPSLGSDFSMSTPITLTAGDNSFDTTNIATAAKNAIVEGVYVHLYSGTNWTDEDTGYAHGIKGKIIEVSGNTAYLNVAPNFTYTVDNIKINTTIADTLLTGGIIDLSAATAADSYTAGITMHHADNSVVENFSITGSDAAVQGISVKGTNNVVRNVFVNRFWNTVGWFGGRVGYGIGLDGINNRVESSIIIDAKHLFVSGDRDAHSNNTVIDNCYLFYTDDALNRISGGPLDGYSKGYIPIDTHANTVDRTLINSYISAPADLMVSVRGKHATFNNNTFIHRAGEVNYGAAGDGTQAMFDAVHFGTTIDANNNRFISYDTGGEEFADPLLWPLMRGRGNTFQNITQDSIDLTDSIGVDFIKDIRYRTDIEHSTFEVGNDGWTINSSSYAANTNNGRSSTNLEMVGSHAYGVFGFNDVVGGGPSDYATISKDFDLTSNEKWILSFYARGSDDSANVTLYVGDDSGLNGIAIIDIDEFLHYYEYEIDGGNAAETISFTNVGYDAFSTYIEGVWVDDIKIYPADPVTGNILGYNGTSFAPINNLEVEQTTGGASHVFIHTDSGTTRLSVGAADGVGTKTPRLNMLGDEDSTAIAGSALFDYGSDDTDMFAGGKTPFFLLRNSNNGTYSTMMLGYLDEGMVFVANDAADAISDSDFLNDSWITDNSCTLSLNESTDEMIWRCKDSASAVTTHAVKNATTTVDSIGTAELNDGSDTPVTGECLLVASDTSEVEYGACSGAAQPATNVSVTTTSFNGLFSNTTSFDTAQELFDYIDDNTAGGSQIVQGDSNATLADSGTESTFTVDLDNQVGFVLDNDQTGGVLNQLYTPSDGDYVSIAGEVYSDTNFHSTFFIGKRAKGTTASPQSTVAGNVLFSLMGQGHNGTDFATLAQILLVADSTTSTVEDGKVTFRVYDGGVAEDSYIGPDGLQVYGLSGSGNAYACLDSNGLLYRSATACN